jgi:hypothetical protein
MNILISPSAHRNQEFALNKVHTVIVPGHVTGLSFSECYNLSHIHFLDDLNNENPAGLFLSIISGFRSQFAYGLDTYFFEVA